MRILTWLKAVCEYLNGCDTEPPPGARRLASAAGRGLWWGLLLGAILLFSGQSTKFIYIDF